ncbi:hypothetical protein RRU01S_18_00010 [Agrobacterium rubi TR3 = NBRC 13261]|uniref:Uncharacterized protein n=1 Tax=Agrobacterium rubi TR3 = NBRC 13261 TaxID=1368415 RepID=A0A081CY00_9HYPH|nr:hypothetical protein RRU01S_18_00010 [Agrobacterium rubi TR3 = NBRC 13261]
MIDWIMSIQKMIFVALSERVSAFVEMKEIANAKAAPSVIKWPGLRGATPGRTINATPAKPKRMTIPFRHVSLSFKNMAARKAAQIGAVNSIDMT